MNRTQRFFSRWTNWVAVLLVLVYFGAAIAAPYLSPQDPKEPGMFLRVGRRMEARPQPPSEKARLGMLPFGYDVYHSLIWGSRDALQFGLIVTLSTATFGVMYGAIAGMAGTRVSTAMLRIADAFLAFPPIAGLVLLQQLYATTVTALGGIYFNSEYFGRVIEIHGPMTAIQFILEHINPLMLSLIIFSWMPYARLMNSTVITLKQTDFVQAARALGASPFWIIRKHLIQNATGPALVLAARDVGGVVLLQATLTFVQIGGGSVWGSMLAQGRNWVIGANGSLLKYWWVFLPPTFAVMIFGIAWNVLGDGLNDVFEPTLHHDFYKPSLWSRLFGKRKVQELPAETLAVYEANIPQPKSLASDTGAQPASAPKAASPNGAASVLVAARDHVSRGQLLEALHAYQHLIQRGKLIAEVLPDIVILVKKYPQDSGVWQALGDALSRSGDTTHAAQSYEQARKLMK